MALATDYERKNRPQHVVGVGPRDVRQSNAGFPTTPNGGSRSGSSATSEVNGTSNRQLSGTANKRR